MMVMTDVLYRDMSDTGVNNPNSIVKLIYALTKLYGRIIPRSNRQLSRFINHRLKPAPL